MKRRCPLDLVNTSKWICFFFSLLHLWVFQKWLLFIHLSSILTQSERSTMPTEIMTLYRLSKSIFCLANVETIKGAGSRYSKNIVAPPKLHW